MARCSRSLSEPGRKPPHCLKKTATASRHWSTTGPMSTNSRIGGQFSRHFQCCSLNRRLGYNGHSFSPIDLIDGYVHETFLLCPRTDQSAGSRQPSQGLAGGRCPGVSDIHRPGERQRSRSAGLRVALAVWERLLPNKRMHYCLSRGQNDRCGAVLRWERKYLGPGGHFSRGMGGYFPVGWVVTFNGLRSRTVS